MAMVEFGLSTRPQDKARRLAAFRSSIERDGDEMVAFRAARSRRCAVRLRRRIARFDYRDPRSAVDIHVNIVLAPEGRGDVVEILSRVYPVDAERVARDVAETGRRTLQPLARGAARAMSGHPRQVPLDEL